MKKAYSLAPEAEGHGTDAAVAAYHFHGGKVRPIVPAVKAVASAITIGSGGSAGREGPTAQISVGAASVLCDLLRLQEADRRVLVLAGMAAGLSAIFRSPLGMAIFAVEIMYARASPSASTTGRGEYSRSRCTRPTTRSWGGAWARSPTPRSI